MFPRVSAVDGNNYAIGFEMRLPLAWNGRFFHQGNGGIDGSVVTATGAVGGGAALTHALQQGFAVLSSDAGHARRAGPELRHRPAGPARLRLPGGGQAHADGQERDRRRPTARARTAPTSAAAPTAAATRWWPRRAMPTSTTASSPARRATTCPRRPSPTSSARSATRRWPPTRPTCPPPSRRPSARTVANAVLARCDALDGATDGLVQDIEACQAAFSLTRDVPTCSGARDGSCLSARAEDGDRADLQRRHHQHRRCGVRQLPVRRRPRRAAASRSGSSSRRWRWTPARSASSSAGAARADAATFNGPAFALGANIDDAGGAASTPPTRTYTESAHELHDAAQPDQPVDG